MAKTKDKTANIHSGHRDRMRAKLNSAGTDAFSDHEILEMILFPIYSRRNTNDIAHELIKTFGSAKNMLSATLGELKEVYGIGERAAEHIFLMSEYYRRICSLDRLKLKITDMDETVDYLIKLFDLDGIEKFRVVCIDKSFTLKGAYLLAEGESEEVIVNPEDVTRIALNTKAKYVIIVHNHITGDVNPSSNDIFATSAIASKLAANNIILVDHIIVGDDNFCSFRENGFMDAIEHIEKIDRSKTMAIKSLPMSQSGAKLNEDITSYLYATIRKL